MGRDTVCQAARVNKTVKHQSFPKNKFVIPSGKLTFACSLNQNTNRGRISQ